jgi:hypothetical protein
MDRIGTSNVNGRVRAYRVDAMPGTAASLRMAQGGELEEYWTPTTELNPNLVLYQWGEVVGKLLSTGDAKYRIGGMYLEFENVSSPGDPVSVPSFGRDRTTTYYNDLSGSSVRDYLRVPLTATTYADEAEQTLMDFFARSSGTTGVHGKTFSDSVNSTIFGASLVAFVDSTDATQDLLLSSYYFAVADQQQKLSTSQVGLEWQLALQ